MTLAQAGRWDEARAACATNVWQKHRPLELRGREAWIEAEQGNIEQAIQQMNAAVAEDPNYYFGWNRLADWNQQLGNAAPFLQAAEKMVQINPHYEVCLGYLGDALLANQDRQGAREAFRRAFEMSPDYEFAGNCLFDMQIEDGDLDAAAATFQVLQHHCPHSSHVMANAVQLACCRADVERAKPWQQLCTTHFDPNSLSRAVNEMRKAKMQDAAAHVLERACKTAAPDDEPSAGSIPSDIAVQWVLSAPQTRIGIASNN